MDIAPGSLVRVQITTAPRTESARKTLARVCAKDAAANRQKRWRKQHRPSLQQWRRGGRTWNHRMKSRLPVVLDVGRSYTLQASLDVIRDLESVERWISVTPAK